jgi:uncharacterized protein (TIGR03083 family)
MDEHEIATSTRREREALVATLAELAEGQWLAPSLCDGWRVVDVAAHLAWAPVLGPGAGLVELARHHLSVNAMIRGTAVAWSARGRDAILAQLSDNARSGARPAGMPPVAALADAVVHGLDVRRPLGLARPVPPEVLPPLAAFTLSTPWPLTAVVGGSARRRVVGLRLVATDAEWVHGDGPEVRGSTEALLLLLYGRHPRRDELTGPGVEVLAARLG